ncbi:SLC13 family permease [Virgibacillus pantothenticus]|uniref:Sodium-dependent dicarboxylate transporter SdcS n=2 Tax=Virgibacillus pantothenticus TaxID=1473 RepID=A0A0L0QST5_VIRPA|nr:DASS family sodium-coupled anion symporter [Virgibacillus pantothenticus]KNE21651.1 anion transporter [Virgibacillus pantothenticus]MED3736288.1 DASS family sodium-coupled anion symporter [Virgibacillus pantothenticus]QTY15917.1 DASS family sodium-coupled anion symporter [Virgibacillus pantothenticus]SIT07914.1 solute carrier family 13 (sodium-dependent dicarboxylate transporter), member 2/3/5 [Virgibacillus pantothenticus]
MKKRQFLGLILGPILFVILFFLPNLTGLDDSPRAVLAVTAWVACWWITEAIPIPATSLLPIFLLPITGGAEEKTATMAYGNPIVFMYMGGFTIALAIEKWNLHKRIAMTIISMVGTSSQRIILGVLLATALLSMWISNAATALMMLPIALALITEVKENNLLDEKSLHHFAKGLLLTVAYAASIGGLATLIGSVPNAVFAGVASSVLDQQVTFTDWFLFGFPLTIILLAALYFYITRIQFKVNQTGNISDDFAKQQLRKLGPMSYEEKAVLFIFTITGALWISSGFLPEGLRLSDTSISIIGATAMFLLPSKKETGELMQWKDMKDLPWGLLLLFGGGLSLAAAFEESGLTEWFGTLLSALESLPYLLILIVLAAIVLFMTEIMSNTAVSNMLIPISIGLAIGIGVDPYGIMAVVALSASCAFMLPISTPPNAAVFSSEYLTIDDMVKAGFWMNIFAILVIVVFVYFWQPIVLTF